MREGDLRSKECDAMLAGTSHYPYTSATHDLFLPAKIQQFPHPASTSAKKILTFPKKPSLSMDKN